MLSSSRVILWSCFLCMLSAFNVISMPQNPYDVFLSHASDQKYDVAMPVRNGIKLMAQSCRVFIDVLELPGGQEWGANLREHMQTSHCGVFILSPEFAVKEWPMIECECFLSRRCAAQARGSQGPLIMPVYYELTWEDCTSSWSKFEQKYGTRFPTDNTTLPDFEPERSARGERIMEILRALTELQGPPPFSNAVGTKKHEKEYNFSQAVARYVYEHLDHLPRSGTDTPSSDNSSNDPISMDIDDDL